MGAQSRSERASRNVRGRPDDFVFDADKDRQELARLRAVDARFRAATKGRELGQEAKARIWRELASADPGQLALWPSEELEER